MIGHRPRFRGNDDLPLWRGLAVKKKPPFLKVAPYSFLTARELISKSMPWRKFSRLYARVARETTQ